MNFDYTLISLRFATPRVPTQFSRLMILPQFFPDANLGNLPAEVDTIIREIIDEATRSDDRGIFSPLLRRERNPSEAEISSHSSTGLHPRFSAKGDKSK